MDLYLSKRFAKSGFGLNSDRFFQKKWNRIHINHVELSVHRNECLRRIGTNLENLENPDPFLSDCTSAKRQGTDPSIRHLILACVVYKLFADTFSSKLQK